VTLATCKVIL